MYAFNQAAYLLPVRRQRLHARDRLREERRVLDELPRHHERVRLGASRDARAIDPDRHGAPGLGPRDDDLLDVVAGVDPRGRGGGAVGAVARAGVRGGEVEVVDERAAGGGGGGRVVIVGEGDFERGVAARGDDGVGGGLPLGEPRAAGAVLGPLPVDEENVGGAAALFCWIMQGKYDSG